MYVYICVLYIYLYVCIYKEVAARTCKGCTGGGGAVERIPKYCARGGI